MKDSKDTTSETELDCSGIQRRRFTVRTGLGIAGAYVAPLVFRIGDKAEAGSKRGGSKRFKGFKRFKGSKRRGSFRRFRGSRRVKGSKRRGLFF